MDTVSLLYGKKGKLTTSTASTDPHFTGVIFPLHFKNLCSHLVCHQGNGNLILLNDVSSAAKIDNRGESFALQIMYLNEK